MNDTVGTDATHEGWAALDRRTVVVTAIVLAGVAVGAGLPTGFGIASGTSVGTALMWVLPGAVLLVAVGCAVDDARWRRTRYRVDAERVELHSGVVVRTRRSLQRSRIRAVDLTADPLLRIFGLVTVRIGTGEHTGVSGSSIVLRPVTRQVADALRRELLLRGQGSAADGADDGRLAQLDPRWIRYAPLSFVSPTLGAAAFGAVMNVAGWFDQEMGVITWVAWLFGGVPLVGMIATLVAIGLVVGTVGALGLFVEMWWNYRLDREAGGTLRVQRGLFTTRSISIEEARLRGVDLVEPLGARLSGAARVDGMVTGLVAKAEDEKTDRRTLLPAAPRAVADRVAADILREPVSPTTAVRLAPHPVAARGRRLRWALGAVLAVEAVLVLLGALLTDVLLQIAWISAVVLVPVAVLLALDAYRSLGHGITGEYLVTRSGTLRRSTAALQRRGIIGWTVRQSVFQRRAGLVTVGATTAAGAGVYAIRDVGADAGLDVAEAAVPELLTPFLEPAQAATRAASPV